jgi:hypothetical protein
MHHLGVGYARREQPAVVLIDATTATAIHRGTAEPSAPTTSTPAASTGATNAESPADGRALNDVATHHKVELRGFEPLTPSMRTRCATGLRHSPDKPGWTLTGRRSG